MESIPVELKDQEFRALNQRYPRLGKSAEIGKSAEQIVRIYFKRKWPQCRFSRPKDGSDLRIQHGESQMSIEIKGTADSTISWQKLKVSSKTSYEMLYSGIPVYRVIKVFDRRPEILVLKHNKDFLLVEEERWAFKPVKKQHKKKDDL